MGTIKQVVILGAGALGAVYASKFRTAAGLSTAFVARGSRYSRLKHQGVVVNDERLIVPVIHADEAADPADLIIVAVKNRHLHDAVHDISNVVGNDTTIISVMNGLDSEEALGAVYGMDKLLYAISVGIDAVRESSNITYTRSGRLIFGEADNTVLSARVHRVQDALDSAGLAHDTPIDMIRTLWWKFMVNVGVNQASAVMRAPYGAFQTPAQSDASADAQALMEALMREVIVLAHHLDVALTEHDIEEWYTFLNTLSPQGKTSMLQDIEAGRQTEVDIFAGKVVALGEVHSIPTPVNRTVLRIIRVLERRGSGSSLPPG
jgi:2-dehydropantoate 2-reductase